MATCWELSKPDDQYVELHYIMSLLLCMFETPHQKKFDTRESGGLLVLCPSFPGHAYVFTRANSLNISLLLNMAAICTSGGFLRPGSLCYSGDFRQRNGPAEESISLGKCFRHSSNQFNVWRLEFPLKTHSPHCPSSGTKVHWVASVKSWRIHLS